MQLSISSDCTLLLRNAAIIQQILSSVNCRACACLLELLKSAAGTLALLNRLSPFHPQACFWGSSASDCSNMLG